LVSALQSEHVASCISRGAPKSFRKFISVFTLVVLVIRELVSVYCHLACGQPYINVCISEGFKSKTGLSRYMRVSIWIGLITLGLGIFLSSLADALIATQTMGPIQTMAGTAASVIFILFSASMLGLGAALIVHWIVGFAAHWKAFFAELILSFAVFFIGIGATIMSGNIWTGLQVFFTFFIASVTLFSLSFISLFGGLAEGIVSIKKYVKKKLKKKR